MSWQQQYRDDVCLIIDFEGAPLAGFRTDRFQHRELGWCSFMGDVGRVAFKPRIAWKRLGSSNQRAYKHVYRNIHSLSYRPDEEEEEVWSNPSSAVLRLWREFRSDHRDRVAFKGGTYENAELMRWKIPYLDLETWGCLKYDRLIDYIPESEELNPGCGFHKDPSRHHCTMRECQAFMRWYKDFMKYH